MEEQLADPRFEDGGRRAVGMGRYAEDVRPIWEAAFKDKTTEEVLTILKTYGAQGNPINDYEHTFGHPHAKHLNMVAKLEHPAVGEYKVLTTPWKISDASLVKPAPCPTLGEHTQQVLCSLGYEANGIESLLQRGIVK